MINHVLSSEAFRETTMLEKLITSLINAGVAFLFLMPFMWADFSTLELKLLFIGLFFAENLLAIFFLDYRLPGMQFQDTRWKKPYSKSLQFIHATLYTASFASMLFWIWIPGDLLVLNILLLQLPCILLTKTTLHGLLAGNMVDVKRLPSSFKDMHN